MTIIKLRNDTIGKAKKNMKKINICLKKIRYLFKQCLVVIIIINLHLDMINIEYLIC